VIAARGYTTAGTKKKPRRHSLETPGHATSHHHGTARGHKESDVVSSFLKNKLGRDSVC
jgi:hypothetical protein